MCGGGERGGGGHTWGRVPALTFPNPTRALARCADLQPGSALHIAKLPTFSMPQTAAVSMAFIVRRTSERSSASASLWSAACTASQWPALCSSSRSLNN